MESSELNQENLSNDTEENSSLTSMASKLVAFIIIAISTITALKSAGLYLKGVADTSSTSSPEQLFTTLGYSAFALLMAFILLQLTHIADSLKHKQ